MGGACVSLSLGHVLFFFFFCPFWFVFVCPLHFLWFAAPANVLEDPGWGGGSDFVLYSFFVLSSFGAVSVSQTASERALFFNPRDAQSQSERGNKTKQNRGREWKPLPCSQLGGVMSSNHTRLPTSPTSSPVESHIVAAGRVGQVPSSKQDTYCDLSLSQSLTHTHNTNSVDYPVLVLINVTSSFTTPSPSFI
ncbi:hypothetical protein LZ31DRAFT_387578 [Colletotrichum somersetense]|nr:hypothetical protein LZ31DRAFT_387578 [Colletotrichum somersetense]